MECPLLLAGCLSEGHAWNEDDSNCLEGECAWWDDVLGQCAVYSLVRNITFLERVISDIEAKLPQARQTY